MKVSRVWTHREYEPTTQHKEDERVCIFYAGGANHWSILKFNHIQLKKLVKGKLK